MSFIIFLINCIIILFIIIIFIFYEFNLKILQYYAI
jgi:hypothetical protein